ncbi:hypothetical protein GCM10010404_68200 [Nonomuraea africana]|uniref:Uncharacterized protein n=1 Tax=Nonomuraea africana TaxID=46171 RepID=A0ABR9KNR9_9ACTN|nr:hypothetical protein [Nonomuraea africana]
MNSAVPSDRSARTERRSTGALLKLPRSVEISTAASTNDTALIPNGSAAAATNRAAPSGGAANRLTAKNTVCMRALARGRSSGFTTIGTSAPEALSPSVSQVPRRKPAA